MSHWRIEAMRLARRALGHGRATRYTLYLHPEGVSAWQQGLPPGLPASFADFDSWCRVHPGTEARLLLSGQGLHSLVIDANLGLQDAETVRTYARQQFAHYYGAPARQWPIAAWSDSQGSSGACALHGFDLQALRDSAATQGVRLLSAGPLWSAGLPSLARRLPSFAMPGRHALALIEGRLVTWLIAEAGAITTLQQRHLDAPRAALLSALLNDLGARSGPLDELPLVVGWGLEDAEDPAFKLPGRVLSPLGATRAALGPWVMGALT